MLFTAWAVCVIVGLYSERLAGSPHLHMGVSPQSIPMEQPLRICVWTEVSLSHLGSVVPFTLVPCLCVCVYDSDWYWQTFRVIVILAQKSVWSRIMNNPSESIQVHLRTIKSCGWWFCYRSAMKLSMNCGKRFSFLFWPRNKHIRIIPTIVELLVFAESILFADPIIAQDIP